MAKRRGRRPAPESNPHPLGINFLSEARPMKMTQFSTLIPQLYARFGLGRRLGQERFLRVWNEIRCELFRDAFPDLNLDEQVRFLSFRGGTVRMEVQGNALYQEMHFYTQEVLASFQKKLPEEKIRKIRWETAR